MSKWVKKGNIYTVLQAANLESGQLGYKLEEIDLLDCGRYKWFDAVRFIPFDDWADLILDEILSEIKITRSI